MNLIKGSRVRLVGKGDSSSLLFLLLLLLTKELLRLVYLQSHTTRSFYKPTEEVPWFGKDLNLSPFWAPPGQELYLLLLLNLFNFLGTEWVGEWVRTVNSYFHTDDSANICTTPCCLSHWHESQSLNINSEPVGATVFSSPASLPSSSRCQLPLT